MLNDQYKNHEGKKVKIPRTWLLCFIPSFFSYTHFFVTVHYNTLWCKLQPICNPEMDFTFHVFFKKSVFFSPFPIFFNIFLSCTITSKQKAPTSFCDRWNCMGDPVATTESLAIIIIWAGAARGQSALFGLYLPLMSGFSAHLSDPTLRYLKSNKWKKNSYCKLKNIYTIVSVSFFISHIGLEMRWNHIVILQYHFCRSIHHVSLMQSILSELSDDQVQNHHDIHVSIIMFSNNIKEVDIFNDS